MRVAAEPTIKKRRRVTIVSLFFLQLMGPSAEVLASEVEEMKLKE